MPEAKSLHPLVELTLMRMREFLREKEAVFWVFIFPVLMTFALGIAFRNTAPEQTLVGIENNGARATEIANTLSHSPEITASVLSSDEAAQGLRSGKISIVVKPDNESWEYRFDPTRPESRAARLLVDDVLQRGNGRADVVNAREAKVTEPGARYVDFLVPGLIGMNLMGSGLWGLGFTVVIARSRKLLKRFAATPMRRSHYLLSFMLSRLVFLVLEVASGYCFRLLVFGFTVRGSWFSVVFITLVGGFTFSGIGLLVAARPTTIEGVSGFDELHHAADVVAVRHVLLFGTISTNPATVHPGAAVDRAEQRAPRVDERRRNALVQLASDRDHACLVCS